MNNKNSTISQLRDAWARATLLWQRMHRPILDANQITPADKRILCGLYNKKKLCKNELAEQLALDNSSLTRSITRLEQSELIKRETDPQDRRYCKLSLSKQGVAKANAIKKMSTQLLQDASEYISEQDLEITRKTLQKINDHWCAKIINEKKTIK